MTGCVGSAVASDGIKGVLSLFHCMVSVLPMYIKLLNMAMAAWTSFSYLKIAVAGPHDRPGSESRRISYVRARPAPEKTLRTSSQSWNKSSRL